MDSDDSKFTYKNCKKMKLSELKKELLKRGINSTGTKKKLLNRVKYWISSQKRKLAASQTNTRNNRGWIQLDGPRYSSRLIKIESKCMSINAYGMLLYDTKNNKWDEKKLNANDSKILYNLTANPPNVCYDSISKRIFMFSMVQNRGNDKELVIFDMKDNKFNKYPCTQFCTTAGTICIDGICHIIGGRFIGERIEKGEQNPRSNLHQIWNDDTKKLETIHIFEEYPEGFSKFELVYIKSRKELLLIGGYDHNTNPDIPAMLDTIFKFSVKTRKWTEFDIKLPFEYAYYGNPIVVTKDERYIIIVDFLSFFILDLMTMVWSRSKIKQPKKGVSMAIVIDNKTEDELLVNGFIRKYMNLYNINIPVAIIGICACFHAIEYIHGTNEFGDHWKIRVNEILQKAKEL